MWEGRYEAVYTYRTPGFVLRLAGSISPSSPARMKADYVEACSCHAFCPCYFNKQAEHPYCQFNMAVQVRKAIPAT